MHFGPTASSTSRWARTRTAPNAQTLANLLGKMLRINTDGTIPTDNPFFNHGHRRQPRHLGARPAQPVHVRVPARHRPHVHQRRGPEHDRRRSTTASRAPTTAGPSRRAPTTNPAHRGPALLLRARLERAPTGCAITGGAFYNPATRAVPARVHGPVLLRRLLQRLDPPAEPGRRLHRHRLRDRRSPARSTCSVADDGSLYYLARGTGSVWRVEFTARPGPADHDAPGEPDGARGPARPPSASAPPAPRRSRTSGSATAPTSPARPSPTYTLAAAPLADDGATFRGRGQQLVRQRHQQQRDAHGHRQQPADRDHHQRRRTTRSTRAATRSTTPAPAPIPSTATCPRSRVHLAGGLPPRHAHPSVPARPPRGIDRRHLHDRAPPARRRPTSSTAST